MRCNAARARAEISEKIETPLAPPGGGGSSTSCAVPDVRVWHISRALFRRDDVQRIHSPSFLMISVGEPAVYALDTLLG